MRSRLVTLITEELAAAFAPGVRDDVLAEALDGGESLDTADAEALHGFADGRLRSTLRDRLGEDSGDVLADAICAALGPHRTARSSGRPPSIFPTVPDLDPAGDTPVSVALLQTDGGLRPLLVTALQTRGITVVVLGASRQLARAPAAEWVDAFVVSSALAPFEAQELARWVRGRPLPALVAVWPAGGGPAVAPASFPNFFLLPAEDPALLARALKHHVGTLRARTRVVSSAS